MPAYPPVVWKPLRGCLSPEPCVPSPPLSSLPATRDQGAPGEAALLPGLSGHLLQPGSAPCNLIWAPPSGHSAHFSQRVASPPPQNPQAGLLRQGKLCAVDHQLKHSKRLRAEPATFRLLQSSWQGTPELSRPLWGPDISLPLSSSFPSGYYGLSQGQMLGASPRNALWLSALSQQSQGGELRSCWRWVISTETHG